MFSHLSDNVNMCSIWYGLVVILKFQNRNDAGIQSSGKEIHSGCCNGNRTKFDYLRIWSVVKFKVSYEELKISYRLNFGYELGVSLSSL